MLNIHAFLPVSYANGPGARAVVWTQGCRLRCPGCCNPGTQPDISRILIEPDRLAEQVLRIPDIEGLTVTGGEPFEQAGAVTTLCRSVKAKGLSVMVFTGWIYERIALSSDTAIADLARQVDILVDGPFVQGLSAGFHPYRGSGNQRVLFLTSRYGTKILSRISQPQMEVHLHAGGRLGITGFPDGTDIQVLARRLYEEGIVLEPPQTASRHYERP